MFLLMKRPVALKLINYSKNKLLNENEAMVPNADT